MAIKSIPDPKMAYQGSVPGTEASGRISAKVSESSASSLPENGQYGKTKSSAAKGMEAGTGENAEQSQEYVGKEALKRAVEEINRNAKHSEAIFGVHDQTNRITIKIVDKETKEVLKEYPPEEMLDMIAKVWEMAGLMVDEKR